MRIPQCQMNTMNVLTLTVVTDFLRKVNGFWSCWDHSPDALNVMARFSQSMLDLRSDECRTKTTVQKNLLNMQNKDKTKVGWNLI